ncbi:hypothetical protein FRC11_009336, partial [Ceratobasidium sp. 423]
MNSQHKQPHVSVEKIRTVTIETEDENDKSAHVEPPKKRGRLKAAPKSIEVTLKHTLSTNADHSLCQPALHLHIPPRQTSHAGLNVNNADSLPLYEGNDTFADPQLPPDLSKSTQRKRKPNK